MRKIVRLALEETDNGNFCGDFLNLQVYPLSCLYFSLLKLPVVHVPPQKRTAKCKIPL